MRDDLSIPANWYMRRYFGRWETFQGRNTGHRPLEFRMGCLSIQVLQEFYVIATQRVRTPDTDDAAIRIIGDLSKWTIHLPDADDIVTAIKTRQRCHISFWDAMIICSAEKLGCSTLWSEDLNHGQTFGRVKVLNPFIE